MQNENLEVQSSQEDSDGNVTTYYKPFKTKVVRASDYNKSNPPHKWAYGLQGLRGFWQVGDIGPLDVGEWYHVGLKTKDHGTQNPYRDIIAAKPTSPPTQGEQGPQNGSQGQPRGDFNTGMAFNQACALTAALIGNGDLKLNLIGEASYAAIIETVLTLRERLYHEVLMIPISDPETNGDDPFDDLPEPEEQEEEVF